MEKMIQIQRLFLRSRRVPLVIMCLSFAFFASAVVITTLQVRKNVREQIAGRDGEVLHAVALLEYEQETQGLGTAAADAAGQLTVLLKTSELKGVVGARLFDADGRFVESFPLEVNETTLDQQAVRMLKQLKPVSRFHPAMRLSEIFISDAAGGAPQPEVPLMEVNVPLHSRTEPALQGVAQFFIEGQSLVAEFAQLDRHLTRQALGTFIVGGGLLLLASSLAFRRLRRANELVALRTEDLIKANQELALAAKTSALGAVTAHLIHGLKNPLAGLQTFVSTRHAPPAGAESSDWQQAIASTRRMQMMIDEVVGLLREEETGLQYQISLLEIGDIISSRLLTQARDRGVELLLQLTTDTVLPNRSANLLGLILINLVQNAIEATPEGRVVRVTAARQGEDLLLEVKDQGPGFPASVPPFAPCRSTKEGGCGIGLAVSRQLANHLGAELRLRESTNRGCIFALTVPGTLTSSKAESRRQQAPN
jgi:signal transduction histidine kinase